MFAYITRDDDNNRACMETVMINPRFTVALEVADIAPRFKVTRDGGLRFTFRVYREDTPDCILNSALFALEGTVFGSPAYCPGCSDIEQAVIDHLDSIEEEHGDSHKLFPEAHSIDDHAPQWWKRCTYVACTVELIS